MKSAASRLLLLLSLGVAIISAATYFSTPASRQPDPSPKPIAESVPTLEQREPPPVIGEYEAAAQSPATGLPASLQATNDRIRQSGRNVWWADAIEIAWTKGFAAAMEHLRQFVPPEHLEEKATDLICILLSEKLELTVEGLALIHEPNHRQSIVNVASSSWARKDPMKLVQFAREHFDGEVRNAALREVVNAFAQSRQFTEAASVLEMMPRSSARERVLEHLAFEWGRRDGDRAFAWARALPTESDQLAAEKRVISSVTEKASLEQVRELAAQYGTAKTQETWSYLIGDRLIAADPEAAIAWLDTQSTDLQRSLQGRIAAKFARTDLAKGTAFALRLEDESARLQALDGIQRGMDNKAMRQWVWTLPEEIQHRVVVSIVTQGYREDEESVKSWVANLPQNRVRDRAAMWLAWQMNKADPAAAGNLAGTINDAQFKQWAFDELKRQTR